MAAEGRVPTKLEELKSHLAVLMDDAQVGTPAMASIDNELVPILKELIRLWSRNDQHPAIRQLFDWLSNTQRSADEFIYVVGPLWMHVWEQNKHIQDSDIFSEHRGFCPCLAKVATEALAAQCPVLKGAWEYAAWVVLNLFGKHIYSSIFYGFASDYLSTWIIHVIGNPDLCPNPYLRIELINLLGDMVNIQDQDKTLVYESVMSACTGLDMEYARECYQHEGFYNLNLKDIYEILDMIIHGNEKRFLGRLLVEKDNYFDQRLVEKVLLVKTSRLSTIFHDVSYTFGLNPNRYTEPKELQGFTNLLNLTVKYSQLHLKTNNKAVGNLLHSSVVLIKDFKRTCQMPQLINMTALCIMEILDHIVILVNRHMLGDLEEYTMVEYMADYEHNFKVLYNENILTAFSPLGQVIIHKYPMRLIDIRKQLEHFSFDVFPTIYNIIYDG